MPDLALCNFAPASVKDGWKITVSSSSDGYSDLEEEVVVNEKDSLESSILENWLEPEEDHLISPRALAAKIPMLPSSLATVTKSRKEIASVINGTSDKLIVVVGPCSIHDVSSAIEYAHLLKEFSTRPQITRNLVIVMRAYLEKPRTTIGWKGLLNDPDLTSTFNMTKGLHLSRTLYSTLTTLGLPLASELLGPLAPPYLSDFISLGAIGARTTESQVHREVASGMPFPIGFKNGTDGGLAVALDAVESASGQHSFVGISDSGRASVVTTEGNRDSFVILRGGGRKTNFDAQSVASAKEKLRNRGRREGVMIDCSHGNSQKNHLNQPIVARDIANQIRNGEKGIMGVMIESNIQAGKQSLEKLGRDNLKRGVSITDACLGWEDTVGVLEELAEAVGVRRGL